MTASKRTEDWSKRADGFVGMLPSYPKINQVSRRLMRSSRKLSDDLNRLDSECDIKDISSDSGDEISQPIQRSRSKVASKKPVLTESLQRKNLQSKAKCSTVHLDDNVNILSASPSSKRQKPNEDILPLSNSDNMCKSNRLSGNRETDIYELHGEKVNDIKRKVVRELQCEDVYEIQCKDVHYSQCKDVHSQRKDVHHSQCKDVHSQCKDVRSQCKDVRSQCNDARDLECVEAIKRNELSKNIETRDRIFSYDHSELFETNRRSAKKLVFSLKSNSDVKIVERGLSGVDRSIERHLSVEEGVINDSHLRQKRDYAKTDSGMRVKETGRVGENREIVKAAMNRSLWDHTKIREDFNDVDQEEVEIDEDFEGEDDSDEGRVGGDGIEDDVIRECSPELSSPFSSVSGCGMAGGVKPSQDSQYPDAISLQSSTPSLPTTPDKHARRASDWIKTLNCANTPEKELSKQKTPEDSAKKRKKFTRGGLAHRLERLMMRQKSHRSVWQHRMPQKLSDSQKEKIISVVVTSLDAISCVIVAEGEVTASCDQTDTGVKTANRQIKSDQSGCTARHLSYDTSVRTMTREENCQSKSDKSDVAKDLKCDQSDVLRDLEFNQSDVTTDCQEVGVVKDVIDVGRDLTVMFSKKCGEHSSLAQGCLVQIYPPWQKMVVIGCKPIILADYYRVMSEVSEVTTSTTQTMTWHFSCPCLTDNRIKGDKCAATLEPCDTDITSVIEKLTKDKSDQSPAITATSVLPPVTLSSTHDSTRVFRLVTECLEHDGGSSGGSVSLSALLHREFRWRDEKSGNIRHSLLISDRHGAFCLTRLLDDAPLAEGLKAGCGERIVVKRYSVESRMLRERNLHLFSIIDRVWTFSDHWLERPADISQEDLPLVAPMFCYELVATGSSSVVEHASRHDNDLSDAKHRRGDRDDSSDELELYEVMAMMMADVTRRIGFTCNLVTYTPSHLYITDTTICDNVTSKPYIVVSVSPEFLCEVKAAGSVRLTDALIQQGSLTVDRYTTVTQSGHCPVSRRSDFVIPTLCLESHENDLVEVHGSICGLDEAGACCWEVCFHCRSDQLYKRDSSMTDAEQLYCTACKKLVETQTRYKMAAYISLADFIGTNWSILLQLSESSILALLPQGPPKEEGHDTQTVLNRPIGPLTAAVTKRDDKLHSFVLREIESSLINR